MTNEIRRLANLGYGYEDICVKLGVWWRSEDGQAIRKLVLRL